MANELELDFGGATGANEPFSFERYLANLLNSGAEAAFDDAMEKAGVLNPRDAAPANVLSAAENLSYAIFDAVEAGMQSETAGISLNYSSGKDSTLMLSLYIRWMMKRKAEGKTLRPLVVGMADTGGELPAMERRMEDECYWINDFAETNKLPIEVFLERPPIKNYLLCEVLGNGKPLPRLTRGGSGTQASEWCMSRVKKTTLDGILKRLESRFPYFVSLLGVRSDESKRRESIIEQYSNGAPRGLCQMGDGKSNQIGCIPIAHWHKVLMRHFLIVSIEDASLMPWRANGDGGRELNNIYRQAAGTLTGENPSECQLTITKDGSISNSCSDLSGTRMGCWMCMLSKNKSLTNIAKVEKSHLWLKKFHAYLFNHHERNFKRIELRDKLGFSKEALFPKGYTFRERYFMTMLLCRAEMESRINLLKPEMISMIEEFWTKYGVTQIKVADARKDAEKWMKSGKPIMSFDVEPDRQGELSRILGLSLPAGAFWEPNRDKGLRHKLEILHMLSMIRSAAGDPLLPAMRSHIFTRANATKENASEILVMVSDTPSSLGGKTNTGLINGLCGAGWIHAGDRQPTQLEYKISNGRVFFYHTTPEKEVEKINAFLAEGKLDDAAAVGATLCANNERRNTGCESEPLAYEWQRQVSEQAMIGKFDAATFKALYATVEKAVIIAENLDMEVQARISKATRMARGNTDKLVEISDDGTKFRGTVRKTATEDFDIASLRDAFQEYRKEAGVLSDALRNGMASMGVIERMAYIIRTSFYDIQEAENELLALTKRLKVRFPEGDFADAA